MAREARLASRRRRALQRTDRRALEPARDARTRRRARRTRDRVRLQIRRARIDETALLDAVATGFGGAWPFKFARALEDAPGGVHVATRDGAHCAFAAHDGNNRGLGWFGPTGTWPGHRGKGLGEALLLACLVDVARDHERCEIRVDRPEALLRKSGRDRRRATLCRDDRSHHSEQPFGCVRLRMVGPDPEPRDTRSTARRSSSRGCANSLGYARHEHRRHVDVVAAIDRRLVIGRREPLRLVGDRRQESEIGVQPRGRAHSRSSNAETCAPSQSTFSKCG